MQAHEVRAGYQGWICRSGEVVGVGDVVAIAYGGLRDAVVSIAAGTHSEILGEVLASVGSTPGALLTLTPEQLLVKVRR